MHKTRILAAFGKIAALLAALLFTSLHSSTSVSAAPNDVIANLWEWPWTSISGECTNVLGPAGFGAVQVAPPADSISVSGHPWWEVYQPAAYDLNSRFGTRAEFASMVAACHSAGVKVYVDAVINHMTGTDQTSTTSYGGASFTNNYSYPSAGYGSADFHHSPADCPNSNNQINNWGSQQDVQECQLSHLSDLRTESDYVRSKIAGYLNDLMSLGVDGFRVDAAKHINVNDIVAIKAKLTTQPSYWSQEVMPGGSGGLSMQTYEQTGTLLEFNAAYQLKNAFNDNIANLSNFGPSSGLEPSAKATLFVENHDTERNGSTLSYKSGATDTLANIFMLAWNYGTPNIMSSFDFTTGDQSPLSDANGHVTAVNCNAGWICQHRGRGIKNMVDFHNVTRSDATVSNWRSDGANNIAFSRGPATAANGWIAINNSSSAMGARSFTTGLAAGTYCDIIHGDVIGGTGCCTGPTVTVASNGTATVSVNSKDAVAISIASRCGQPLPPPTATFRCDHGGTVMGQSVYVVGNIDALGNWIPANALKLDPIGPYPTWVKTGVQLPPNTNIQWKCIKRPETAPNPVVWEPDPNNTLNTPATGDAGVAVGDFGGGIVAENFICENGITTLGQSVYVVGSHDRLGSWDPGKAVKLDPTAYPRWSGSITELPAGTQIQWKCIKRPENATQPVVWQPGPNNVFVTPNAGTGNTSGGF
ncbi:MAG TPA: carbohydrate-binding module family 20 domain-containing protein [Methylococcaceae bacterium]|jgi:alpha-amylase|nr:carbohydrate-binding module family 20 domain-containing protein [Methylococcaceae bacterium]